MSGSEGGELSEPPGASALASLAVRTGTPGAVDGTEGFRLRGRGRRMFMLKEGACCTIKSQSCGGAALRVLLVEDDTMIAEGVLAGLKAAGMSVDWVREAAEAEEALRSGGYAIALLDLGLPGADGLDVLRLARRQGVGTPVLVITARDGVDDRVRGLDLGADDYLVKPFELRELEARMRAVIRRQTGRTTAVLIAGTSELNTETHELTRAYVAEVLPAREYALMFALMERPGRILSRAQIEERIYGWGEEVESNAVDVLIHSIRRKFGKDTILNVRGAGWLVPKS